MFKEFPSDMPGLELHQVSHYQNTTEKAEDNEEKYEIMEAISDLKRKLSSEFYADPNKRILPEFYNDKSNEGKQRLNDLKKNKFRKGWFTATLGDMQLATRLLDSQTGKILGERVKKFSQEVVAATEVDYVLIAKCEGLAKVTIQLLQEKLDLEK